MASKKEHRRKQKSRGPEGVAGGENPFLQSGVEINSLDLLSSMYSVPKATEGNGGAGKHKDKTPSAKEEQERQLREYRRIVVKNNPVVRKVHSERPTARFLFTLKRGEMFRVMDGGEERLVIFKTAPSTTYRSSG